jgi:DNA-binding transcriptional regulator YbjK
VLLDASLHVIGTRGLREATHRAVETQAGVPHGSVTYYFGNRDGLLAAAVERMRELDEHRVAAMAQQLVMAFATSGLDAVIDAVAEGGAAMFEENRISMQARYEMLLAGARDEAIGTLMQDCTRIFWELAKPVAIAAGSPDPDGDARNLMAMLDGLFFDQLTKGPPDPELLRRGIRQALRSVTGG